MVIFLPGGSSEKPEILTDKDLKSLRDYPSNDRIAQLDIDALKIKTPRIALLIEFGR